MPGGKPNFLRTEYQRAMAERRRCTDMILLMAGPTGGVELFSQEHPEKILLVTPDIRPLGAPATGEWRVTTIDNDGPYGHTVFRSREAALRACAGECMTEDVPGAPHFAFHPYIVKRRKNTRPAPPPGIAQRIRAAWKPDIGYHALMRAVFPEDKVPRAWRHGSNGGPPGCCRAFGKALRSLGMRRGWNRDELDGRPR
jgi:hypothetical protein